MQIEPQTPLAAVYQITDHTDSSRDSYYVRAIVRDSVTDDVIGTYNLISEGVGRYKRIFNAPVDGSGLGRQIDVTITVYTDSLYTIKHASYAETIERWYVKSQPTYFGSGGEDIDYKKVREIIREEMEKCMDDMEKPELVDLEPVMTGLESLKQAVAGIEIPEMPEMKEPTYEAVLGAIQALGEYVDQKIGGIEFPTPTTPEVDLSRVHEGIQNLADSIGDIKDITQAQKNTLVSTLEKTVRELYKKEGVKQGKIKEILKTMIDSEEPTPVSSTAKPYSKLFSS